MHLLDMPKPNRPRRPLGTLLLVITGFCLGVALMCIYNANSMCRLPASERRFPREAKHFMQKYELTQKQVAMIKREGKRIKKEAKTQR